MELLLEMRGGEGWGKEAGTEFLGYGLGLGVLNGWTGEGGG